MTYNRRVHILSMIVMATRENIDRSVIIDVGDIVSMIVLGYGRAYNVTASEVEEVLELTVEECVTECRRVGLGES